MINGVDRSTLDDILTGVTQGPVLGMLGTFPKAVSQSATSHGHFPKRQLLKCGISQAATSQIYIFPNDNFSSGNFPMKEKWQLPKCTFSQVIIPLKIYYVL